MKLSLSLLAAGAAASRLSQNTDSLAQLTCWNPWYWDDCWLAWWRYACDWEGYTGDGWVYWADGTGEEFWVSHDWWYNSYC